MSDGSNVFSFELNESLYFTRGYEVNEMVGIALDPEISIQSYNDYVSIRGVIELQGEYIKANSESEQMENELETLRYIEKIEDSENNRALFSHRFPVEISVSLYRVANLNDVAVSIESFDYELPQPNHLKLKSTIDIHGISEEQRTEEVKENKVDEERVDTSDSESSIPLDATFSFDIKQEEIEQNYQEDLPVKNKGEDSEQDETVPREFTKEDESSNIEQKKQTDEALVDEYEDPQVETPQTIIEVQSIEDHEENLDKREDLDGNMADDILTDEEESNDVDIEDDRYLAEMLRIDEVESQYVQMRLCIVQDYDTIESIAEKYDIKPSQILKQNDIEVDELAEGQLLYIPSQKK